MVILKAGPTLDTTFQIPTVSVNIRANICHWTSGAPALLGKYHVRYIDAIDL